MVEISFTVAPEFNQTLTVQPDGYVMLKDAGMVEVQGLNLQQFSEAVQKAYRGYLHDPQVAVALKEFRAALLHCGRARWESPASMNCGPTPPWPRRYRLPEG